MVLNVNPDNDAVGLSWPKEQADNGSISVWGQSNGLPALNLVKGAGSS